MKALFQTALNAAQAAGSHIQESLHELKEVDHKGRADMVTNVDTTSEQIIVDHILDAYPDHGILAEESDYTESSNTVLWIIDPLDGTTNFVHGYQHYSVSIAVEIEGTTEIGIVYDPRAGELFSAIRGEGAYVNDAPIHISGTENLRDALLSTGMPYDIDEKWYRAMELFRIFYGRSHGVRRDGSASLDLCYVAAGRFDGFWEYSLNPWDVTAGLLICREAGGRTTDFTGAPADIFGRNFLGTNGKIHDQMLELIKLIDKT